MEDFDEDLCQLLLNCLKRGHSEEVAKNLYGISPARWQAFVNLAALHRLGPLIWNRIQEKGLTTMVPKEAAEKLQRSLLVNTTQNLRLYGELRRLLSALQPEGIRLILLKGIYLATAIYEQIGLREMSDIDVLARSSDLPRIVPIMMDLGYLPLDPIHMDVTFQAAHHLPRMVKEGVATFELHWNLVLPGESYSIDVDGLWKQAVPLQLVGYNALILSVEDLLLHLCVHASHHHQFHSGLRSLCDIAETIHRFNSAVNWHAIIEQAIIRKWDRGVYLTLRLTKEMVGADVPTFVLERLQPDDVPATLMERVRTHIFAHQGLSFHAAKLLESGNLWMKLRIFFRRVFLPKVNIAALYSLPADSVKIYGCYLRRFFFLLRRYGNTLKKFNEKDASTRALAERANSIAKWLMP
jgi:hypothetical protein